jgi:hypothetical protein
METICEGMSTQSLFFTVDQVSVSGDCANVLVRVEILASHKFIQQWQHRKGNPKHSSLHNKYQINRQCDHT